MDVRASRGKRERKMVGFPGWMEGTGFSETSQESSFQLGCTGLL